MITATFALPLHFQIARPNLESKLCGLDAAFESDLLARGLELIDLTSTEVHAAFDLKAEHPEISMHDAMSIVLAHRPASCLLIVGELERKVATACDIDTRHLLWLVEQMEQAGTATYGALASAVDALSAHPLVACPDGLARVIASRLRELGG